MNSFKTIRDKLGVTQAELAVVLERSQGNVAFYEKGQTVPPEVAKRLITFAASRGCVVSFDDIYGAAPLPAEKVAEQGVVNV